MIRPRAAGSLLRLSLATLLAGGTLLARPSSEGVSESGGGAGAENALARTVATPGDAGRENDLGNHLQLAGDLDGAEAAYRRAIAAAPGNAKPHYNLGCLLLERGRRFSARRELVRALELDPQHAEARLALGMVYDELGFDRLARRHYRQAFELAPALADPKLHPEVARHRQALAALLELWRSEPEPLASGATSTAKSAETAAGAESARDAGAAEAGRAAPGSAAGGGYARITGGERTSPSAVAEADEEGEIGAVERPSRGRTRGANDAVIDPSDLRTGSIVNQVTDPGAGASERGGRGATSRPTKPSRGSGSRFTPPARPFDPEFEPDEESTGRLEPIFLPVDLERFAIAG